MTTEDQAAVCARVGVVPSEVDALAVVGVGPLGGYPLNGLRHPPRGQSNGWYLWTGGEFPPEPDFCRPVHVAHLTGLAPQAMKYLALPPGWRFQVAPGHEDVWSDDLLLDV